MSIQMVHPVKEGLNIKGNRYTKNRVQEIPIIRHRITQLGVSSDIGFQQISTEVELLNMM